MTTQYRENNQREAWAKTWLVSIFHPTTERLKFLSFTEKPSLAVAIFLFIFASVFYTTVTKLTFSSKSQEISSFSNNIIFVSLTSIISGFLFCAIINYISKMVGKRSNLKNLFIVYSFFNSPFIILFGLGHLLGGIIHSSIDTIGGLLEIYALLWLNTVAIESIYNFSRWRAFLLNLTVMSLIAAISLFLYFQKLY